MRVWRHLLVGLVLLPLIPTAVRAESPPSPLRLAPEQADLLFEVKNPRKLIETYLSYPPVQEFISLDAVREQYGSTNYRRFQQLIAYFEKELGAGWPELTDRLTGGGAVVAIKFGTEPPHTIFVVQGKDEALTARFVKLALQVAGEELARKDGKDKIEKGTYREVETIKVGSQFRAAAVGAALVIANSEEALHAALDLHRDPGKKSLAGRGSIDEARKLFPAEPLAFLWGNLETAHNAPQGKDVFKLPRNDFNLTVLFGGWLDVAGRAPFVTGGLLRDGDDLVWQVRMPRGRDGSAPAIAMHIPPEGAGTPPLLEPKGVLYSSSYHLDLAKVWEDRKGLFSEKNLTDFEAFDKKSGAFLLGTPFSKLVTQVGPTQRFLVATQAKALYTVTPRQKLPAFALVAEMREPEAFSRSLNSILRTAALLGTFQVKLKLIEEKHGEHTLVGYRFPEDAPFKGDEENLRFNFTPCFARVGSHYVVSSTMELGHELIDLLEKEDKAAVPPSPLAVQSKLYGQGGADYLKRIENVLLAQTILDRAVSPESAREETKALLDWVRKLGVLRTEVAYGKNDFRYEIRLVPAK